MRKLLCLVSPLALLAAMPVHAQEASTTVEGLTVTSRYELETEVGKLDAPIAATPQAISVVTNAEFTQRGAQNLQETLRYTAGVVAEAYGNDGRNDYSLVRGVEAPIYLDGLRQTFGYYAPRTEIYQMDRVEVLKGPGGSLYGAGTVGGLVNQTSKRPQFEAAGEGSISYGTYDRFQISADATGPLNAAGTLAGRLVAVARDSGTQTDYVPDDRILVAPSLTWNPTEATSITVLGTYQSDNTATISTFAPYVTALLAPPGRRLPTNRFFSEPNWEKYDTELMAVTLLAEHRVNETITLRSRTRYIESELDYQSIYPDSYTNPADPFINPGDTVLDRYIWAIYPDTKTLLSDNHVQLRLETGAVRHTVLAGVDYARYKQKSTAISGVTTPIDAYNPVYGNFTVPAGYTPADEGQTQTGLYLQDHLHVGERWSFILGARHDRAEALGGQVDEAATYRAAAMVDIGHGLSPYLSYSESFQPQAGADKAGDPFEPTRGEQWEAGLKWTPTPQSLITLAAYQIVEQNRLTPDPTDPNFSVQTGEVELQGVELEGVLTVAGVDLSGALTFADTEITDSNTPSEIGRPLDGAARRQASLFASRPFDLGQGMTLRLGGGVRHTGDSYSGDIRTPDFTVGDLFAELDWREWTARLNGTNVTDEIYYSTCLARGDCFLGVRRTVNFAVTRRF